MAIGDLIGLLALLLATGLGGAGLIVLCVVLMPGLVGRAAANLARMPLRSLAVGLVNGLFFGLLAAALAAEGGDLGRLLGLLLLVGMLGLMAAGLSGLALLVGERLGYAAAAPARRALIGAGLLGLAMLAPVVGWVGVTLLAGLAGYGALIIALFQRRSTL